MLLHDDKRHIEGINFLAIQKVILTRSSVQIAIWWIAVDRFMWSIHPYSSSFLQCIDQLDSNSFISLINKPTRVKNQSATLIDNIFTNSLSDMDHTIQGIIYSDISDHFPIIHINYSFQAANLDSEIVVINLSQRNKQAFCRAVSEVNWGPLYISGNAQEYFTWFHSTLISRYNKHFPKEIMNKKYNTRKMWLTELLKNGEFVIGVFLDFSKAFDTVDHAILLSKLSHYGIRGSALQWFENYLSNQKQYVTYYGVSSPVNNITCGVPKGSILGPLLFLLYTTSRQPS